MTNLVMIARDRPRLTEQALRTIYANTPFDQFNITLVDDGSRHETREIIMCYAIRKNCEVVTFIKPIGIVGFLRNVGALASERFFGRGKWLCFLDNDVAVFPGWLEKMTRCKEMVKAYDLKGPAVLGGCRHPFHQPVASVPSMDPNWRTFCEITDAVAGYSMLMRWECFDLYGPFEQEAKGIGQSEDYAFCQKVIRGPEATFFESCRNWVGYIHPPVLAHCGITNSNGEPATGADQFERVEGYIYE